MGTNLKQFQKEMQEMEDEVKDAVAGVIKDSCLSGYENALRPKSQGGTPRITGHLRANTYISANDPIEEVNGSKENVDTSKRDAKKREFENLSTEQILKTNKIFITWTPDYASFPNDGSDSQRGQHFMEKSAQDIGQTLKQKRNIK